MKAWPVLSEKILHYLRTRFGSASFPHGVEFSDFVSDAMLKILTSIDTFEYRGKDSFWKWVQTLAGNLWRDFWRRHERDRKLGLLGRGDVHGGRERVVRRLPAVDVVVGMDRRLAAHHAAGQLDGAVRDDLVHVHVALRPGARLPHHQREVVVQLARDDLVGRVHDQVLGGPVQLAERVVGERRRLLEDAERAHDVRGHALLADAEVVARALRLRAVVAVVRHLDGAHGVGFDAGAHVTDLRESCAGA